MMTQTNNTEKLRRAAQAQRYAPRVKPSQVAQRNETSTDVLALRKLTARVLDELKKPTAVPSQVILAALIEARGR